MNVHDLKVVFSPSFKVERLLRGRRRLMCRMPTDATDIQVPSTTRYVLTVVTRQSRVNVSLGATCEMNVSYGAAFSPAVVVKGCEMPALMRKRITSQQS